MKLAELLTYFRMKDMIVYDTTMVGGSQLQNQDTYQIRIMRINRNDYEHAIIIYRKKNDRVSLINADIFYSELSSTIPDRVFLEGTTLARLEEEMCRPKPVLK